MYFKDDGLDGEEAKEGRKERGDVEDAGVKRGGCWALAGSGLKRRKTGRDGGHPSPARRRTWLDPPRNAVENIRSLHQVTKHCILARRNMSSASTFRLDAKWTSPRPSLILSESASIAE